MDKATLAEILRKHRDWLYGEVGGERADLREADLRGADLSRANLREADLREADLRGADLNNTILAPALSPWAWAQTNHCPTRVVGGRVLVLVGRTRKPTVMGGDEYALAKLYRAPLFSRCPVTDCHPGLYLGGNPNNEEMLVACWLDEIHIAPTKTRVPRFYTLPDRNAWEMMTGEELEAK